VIGVSETKDAGDRAACARPRRRRSAAILLRAALLVVVVVAVVELQSPGTYLVSTGSVTFEMRPEWPGGQLVLPLGPAGELSLRTHRTPVDVVMDYRLPAETAALIESGGEEVERLQGGALAAFRRYLLGRIPWLLLAGAAAGVLVGGVISRRRLVWGAAGGAAAAVLVGVVIALATYATIDRSPSVRYEGLAARVPELLPLISALSGGGDQSDRLGRLQDFIDGLEAVATELATEPRRPARAEIVRLLLASDIHDNVFGARAAARLAAGGGVPVDGVLFAGDLTDRGTAEEAELVLRAFGALDSTVLFVGGNHEDDPAMEVFARAGFLELQYNVVTIQGVTILGASDAVAHEPQVDSDEARLETAAVQLAESWRLREPRPRVVLVHDLRQADDVVAAAKDLGRPLLVAHGNDHVAGVTTDDVVILVDAGTAGASGYESIGGAWPELPAGAEPPASTRDVYTFQLIDFSRADPSKLVAVTTVSYGGSGRTIITYTPFGF
jgi:predicted phosphodiesterase